ncbi:hypothetical protein EZV62_000383 [Acer yangbiense]|uniref:Uncharacterized protein n=1 Tax=Acer yangbiense TaxID=1000413 RepID=A0A5C7ISK1_9ROSI|nr:hypothetical protein EZV62_000383 [Acer yangbiense]
MAASTLRVSTPGAVPRQIDSHHHNIQMEDILFHLQSTESHQNQLMIKNIHAPRQPNLPISDLRTSIPRQKDTIVVSLAAGPQIDSDDLVLPAESSSIDADHSTTQSPQNQNHVPTYQLNSPDRSLLPYESNNRDQYRLKCVPLQKAALTGNLLEAIPLLGDVPRWMLRTAITERDQTVLHLATGAKKVGFVEEIVKLMEPDDLKLQDRKGNTAFCIAAAVGSLEIAKLMLDKTPNLLTLRGAANVLPLFMAALFGKTEMTKFLYDETKFHLTDQDLADLFFKSITTDLYDIALKLLEHRPELAVTRDENNDTALHVLVRKPSSMFARERIGIFKRLTYWS